MVQAERPREELAQSHAGRLYSRFNTQSSTMDYPNLPPGLIAVTGDERTGKTQLLRDICHDASSHTHGAETDALYLDLSLPGQDTQTPLQVWVQLQQRCLSWNALLQHDLMEALGLQDHLQKTLSMLSNGSRRKVALVGLLASGVKVTGLDQPYAALDGPSIRVIREFLSDMADHPSRSWVVADYEADSHLSWNLVIRLDGQSTIPSCA